MSRVLLGVTGSVASILIPKIVSALVGGGHQVKVVATPSALRFFDPKDLQDGVLLTDSDEWRFGDRDDGCWSGGDRVLHIDLREWADLLLLAPLDANTLAKISLGLSDNLLTCVFRAWKHPRPVVLAPAMNTLMWDSPQTARHLRGLYMDHSVIKRAPTLETRSPGPWVRAFGTSACPHIHVVGPVVKQLACGGLGVGGMAPISEIVGVVGRVLDGAGSLGVR